MTPFERKPYPWSSTLVESRFPMHLQWFAAEDEGRTEDPTETKIRKAREEGKVAKSIDIVAAVVLLFPMALIGFLASYFWNTLVEMLRYYFGASTTLDPISGGSQVAATFYLYMAKLLAPVLAVSFIGALVANLVQVGFLFTVKPIVPDFTRIVPKFGKWIQRSLFSTEALFNVGKQLVKVVAIGVLAWLNVQSEWGHLINLLHVPFSLAVETLARLIMTIVLESAVLLLALAVPDYLFQRNQHKESLKMSKEEIKEERKQQEGDPLIRSRLRERMREILRRNMMQNVPKADVIITNPTHFAIGLQWDSLTMTAPTVIAKGQDLIAQKIKEIASNSGVPLVENKPLARALYASVDIGDQIPQEYWEIVSKILAEIYRLGGKAQAVVS